MKLILTAEVDHLGAAGDTVEVKDGYGRNYLLPRGLAIAASRGAQKQADEIRRARETKTVRDREHADEIKAALAALGSIQLPVKTAADSGKLFGSVTANDIVVAIKKAGGPNLDKRTVAAAQGSHQGDWRPHRRRASAPRGERRRDRRRRRTKLAIRVNSPGGGRSRSLSGNCCISGEHIPAGLAQLI